MVTWSGTLQMNQLFPGWRNCRKIDRGNSGCTCDVLAQYTGPCPQWQHASRTTNLQQSHMILLSVDKVACKDLGRLVSEYTECQQCIKSLLHCVIIFKFLGFIHSDHFQHMSWYIILPFGRPMFHSYILVAFLSVGYSCSTHEWTPTLRRLLWKVFSQRYHIIWVMAPTSMGISGPPLSKISLALYQLSVSPQCSVYLAWPIEHKGGGEPDSSVPWCTLNFRYPQSIWCNIFIECKGTTYRFPPLQVKPCINAVILLSCAQIWDQGFSGFLAPGWFNDTYDSRLQ